MQPSTPHACSARQLHHLVLRVGIFSCWLGRLTDCPCHCRVLPLLLLTANTAAATAAAAAARAGADVAIALQQQSQQQHQQVLLMQQQHQAQNTGQPFHPPPAVDSPAVVAARYVETQNIVNLQHIVHST